MNMVSEHRLISVRHLFRTFQDSPNVIQDRPSDAVFSKMCVFDLFRNSEKPVAKFLQHNFCSKIFYFTQKLWGLRKPPP